MTIDPEDACADAGGLAGKSSIETNWTRWSADNVEIPVPLGGAGGFGATDAAFAEDRATAARRRCRTGLDFICGLV